MLYIINTSNRLCIIYTNIPKTRYFYSSTNNSTPNSKFRFLVSYVPLFVFGLMNKLTLIYYSYFHDHIKKDILYFNNDINNILNIKTLKSITYTTFFFSPTFLFQFNKYEFDIVHFSSKLYI